MKKNLRIAMLIIFSAFFLNACTSLQSRPDQQIIPLPTETPREVVEAPKPRVSDEEAKAFMEEIVKKWEAKLAETTPTPKEEFDEGQIEEYAVKRIRGVEVDTTGQKISTLRRQVSALQLHVSTLEDKVSHLHPKSVVKTITDFFGAGHELTKAGKAWLDTEIIPLALKGEIEVERIVGHASLSKPNSKCLTNQQISETRAHNTKKYLADQGVDVSNTTAIGGGETNRYGRNENNQGVTIYCVKVP